MAKDGGAAAPEKQESGKNGTAKFIFSTGDTCEFFGITRQALSKWQKKGAPQAERGKWDLKALVEWRYNGRHMESPETRKLKAEADLKEAKAAQEKIKLGVKKEEFISAEDVRGELARLLANMKKSMLAIGHDVASDLASLDPEAVTIAKNRVEKRIDDALKELAEGRLYRGRTRKKAKK